MIAMNTSKGMLIAFMTVQQSSTQMLQEDDLKEYFSMPVSVEQEIHTASNLQALKLQHQGGLTRFKKHPLDFLLAVG